MLNAAEVARHLDLPDPLGPWLAHLEELGDVPALPRLAPPAAEASLGRLGVAPEDAREIAALLPALHEEPPLVWLLARCHSDLTRAMGDENATPFQAPRLLEHPGVAGGLFWLAIYLAAVADVRRWHAARGIPDDVSWATLSLLGDAIAAYRQEHGRWGVDLSFFDALAFRGVLFRVGRLSYIPYRLCTGPAGPLFWYDAAAPPGHGFRPGDPALSIHVPASAPLDAVKCGTALRRAGEIFADHFLPHAPRVGTCTSWLLDPQLADYLPATSNIIRFQQRFQLVPGVRIDNEGITAALRSGSESEPDQAPRESRLQRAAARHLAAGKDWHLRTGWLDLRKS